MSSNQFVQLKLKLFILYELLEILWYLSRSMQIDAVNINHLIISLSVSQFCKCLFLDWIYRSIRIMMVYICCWDRVYQLHCKICCLVCANALGNGSRDFYTSILLLFSYCRVVQYKCYCTMAGELVRLYL